MKEKDIEKKTLFYFSSFTMSKLQHQLRGKF